MDLRNWAGNITFAPGRLLAPHSLDELRQVVADHQQLRALGTAHSFNRIADSPGELVSVRNLPGGIEFDDATGTVSVPAGARYWELAGALQAHGRALANLGSLPHISVAGACATGTHGSGDLNGILSTSIAAIDLVTADGERITIDRSAADLPAIAVGLGAFGVIIGLTLDIQ